MNHSQQIPSIEPDASFEPARLYRALFEAHPLPMLVVDTASGRIHEANTAAEIQYDRSRAEFPDLPLKELWASGFPARVPGPGPEEVCRALSGRWMHRRSSGQTFPVELSCRTLPSESDCLALVLAEDASRRGRVAKFDAAISKLGQKLSEATTPRSAGRVIADISRDLIGWDACSITLYSPEKGGVIPVFAMDTIDGVLTPFPGTVPPGAVPSPVFQDIMKNGSRLIHRDDEDFAATSIPFGDTSRRSESLIFVAVRKGDQAVGVLSIQSYQKNAYSARDVKTLEALASHCAGALERIRVESALRIAEQRFAHAFQSSPVAMYIGTFEDGRALAVNSAFIDVFGFSREDLLGKNGLELGFWEDPHDREEIYDAIRSGRKVRDVQARFRTKSRELRHILVSVEVIEVEGERCLLFFNYDITKRVNLESQLRQSQKLESIGQVTAGVAHDFNNLLTVVDGCSSLALENTGLDAETRDLLEQISFAAERAGNVTRHLLAFSSRQKMVRRELNLNTLLKDLSRMLQQLVGARVQVNLDLDSTIPRVSADSGMLEQVVVNLVVNARDAMPEGGSLRIETVPSEIGPGHPEAAPGSYVCFRVSDTGCGIPPGNLPRLFEPFFTTKEVGKGSGLGLATSYGIVKQHGGWIDVRSRIGEGTTFLVHLPSLTAEPGDSPEKPEATVAIPQGNELILVVEDEPAVRDLACHVLKYYGYQTLEASSGAAGLEIWKAHSEEIDAVVTDIVMPGGMDGREMARLLLQDRPDLPILYMSGYSPDIAGQDISLQDGVNFLQKPFEAATLAQTLRANLDKSTSPS